MDVQDVYYLTGTIFFVLAVVGFIYIIFLITKIKIAVEEVAYKIKNSAENIALTGYSLKASLLKMFLNIIGAKSRHREGGERYE